MQLDGRATVSKLEVRVRSLPSAPDFPAGSGFRKSPASGKPAWDARPVSQPALMERTRPESRRRIDRHVLKLGYQRLRGWRERVPKTFSGATEETGACPSPHRARNAYFIRVILTAGRFCTHCAGAGGTGCHADAQRFVAMSLAERRFRRRLKLMRTPVTQAPEAFLSLSFRLDLAIRRR